MKKAKHWYDYLWICAILYFTLGFFNILFAWLGMIDFLLPLFLAIFGGNKFFCNHLCGRGQLFSKLGTGLKCSRCKPTPRWMSSKWFRYGFLLFFLTMFGNMVFQTYLVAAGAASLREAIKLFWTFRVPWGWTYTAGTVADWVAQFSFGFYSLMLTSLLHGPDRYGALQAPYMVRLLPHGNHDAGYLQAEKQRLTNDTHERSLSHG